MKLFKNILLLTIAVLFAACDTDVDTPMLVSESECVAPVMGNCNNVIVNLDNSNSETVVFSWTAADFGQPVQILYSVYVTDGTNEGLVGTSNITNLVVAKGDLNGVVINSLGYAPNTTATVKAYVTAQIAEAKDYATLKSNVSNEFTVATFAAALKYYYLCGAFNGNWDIDNAPIFYETAGGTNTYMCMVDFATNSEGGRGYFKVVAGQTWSGDNWGYNYLDPSWECPEQKDSNLSVDVSSKSIHQLTMNVTTMKIDDKAIGNTIGLVGSFNDWGASADPLLVYDYMTSSWRTEPVSLAAGDEVKLRVDSDWALNWGAGAASKVIDGGFDAEVNGSNITIAEAGSYVVILHANRTPMVIELEKQ